MAAWQAAPNTRGSQLRKEQVCLKQQLWWVSRQRLAPPWLPNKKKTNEEMTPTHKDAIHDNTLLNWVACEQLLSAMPPNENSDGESPVQLSPRYASRPPRRVNRLK